MADIIAQGLAAGGATAINALSKLRKFHQPKLSRGREVMATPPTITTNATGTHTIASYRSYPAITSANNGANFALNPNFSWRKGCNPTMVGTGWPWAYYVQMKGVNNSAVAGGNLISNLAAVAFLTDSQELELFIMDAVPNQISIKVNGQYTSLTPIVTTNTSGSFVVYINFGSYAMREVEFIMNGGARIQGVFTNQAASLSPAKPRGPKTILMGDSFSQPTGSSTYVGGYPCWLGDLLGWDDLRPSGVGATGLVANNGGACMPWTQRVALDVIPYAPEVFILQGSVNDSAQTYGTVYAAAVNVINQVRAALPSTVILMTSPLLGIGAGFAQNGAFIVRDALADVARDYGIPFVDLLEGPVNGAASSATSTTLSAAAAANATTLTTTSLVAVDSTYKFADRTHVYVKAVTGSGPYTLTVDRLGAAQASGATMTLVGNSAWSGNGRVGTTNGSGNCDRVVSADGVHPSDAGHEMIANYLANFIAAQI